MPEKATFDRGGRLPDAAQDDNRDNSNDHGSLTQSPELNAQGDPTRRAIRDAGMAKDIIQTVAEANRIRQTVNNRIFAKYNAERPYEQKVLENSGLGWRSNFTTKPLPSMIEKVSPRFEEAVAGLKYLTSAALSSRWEGSATKTERFRTEFTKLIRGRKEWPDLVGNVALDNALWGGSVLSWLDEFSWFPKHYRHDEFLLPDGTKQSVTLCQIAVLKETYLPHELYGEISDKEAAETTGWHIDNTRELINKASPKSIRDDLLAGGHAAESWYQHAERDLSIGASYMAGASIIPTYSLLVREVTGKVSHYRLGGDDLIVIYSHDDRFESTEDCLAFFSFQRGSGTFHGSKGVGRDIYELASMQDRSRNEVVDRAILSGKTLVQGDPRQLHKFKMSVIGAMVIVPQGWNILERKFDGNIESFLQLDAYFQHLVDGLIGNVSVPQAVGGEAMRSSAAWEITSAREEEGKDHRINRFLNQFVRMIQTIQKHACNPDTNDEDAKEFQKKMLDIMSPEELEELRYAPVAETIRDLTPTQRQMIVAIASEKGGNPLYNRRQLEIEDLTARVNAEFADRVLLAENDPTEQAEQQRLQQLELGAIMEGTPVPVSPRDSHLIHLETLMPFAENVAKAMQAGQVGTPVFEAIVLHINEHVEQGLNAGISKEEMKPYVDFAKNAVKAIDALKELDQQAGTMQDESAALDAQEQELAPVEDAVLAQEGL
jgi:hypothetical protein